MAAKSDEQELELLALIDAEFTWHPFYGSRKIRQYLRGLGYKINRKRVQRLMGILGLTGMAPEPNTSLPHPRHKVYPYLLRGVAVARPNQVWINLVLRVRKASIRPRRHAGETQYAHQPLHPLAVDLVP